MKYIKNYADQAAYDADTREGNVVSLIKDSSRIKHQKVNIITEANFASIGDTVVFDTEDQRPKVVKLDTLTLPLPSRYVICGTVHSVDNEFVYMVANQNLSAQWGAPKLIKMSGFSEDFTITINTSTTATISSSGSLEDIAGRIQAEIQAIMTTHPAGWTATAYDGYVVVQQNSYTPNVTNFTCSDSGVTVEELNGNYQTATSGLLNNNNQIFRKDGSVATWAGCHFEKFHDYYSVNGEDVTGRPVGVGNVIKESRFNMTDNPELVEYYGTYRNYVADKMARYPYGKGIMNDVSGKENTSILSEVTYVDHDGSVKLAYPAASAAFAYGIPNTMFDSGWWLASAPEWLPIMEGITYTYNQYPLDPISRGLKDAGGTYINPSTHFWTSSEYSGYYAWSYYGVYGRMLVSSKLSVYAVRPVSRFSKK